MSLDVDHLLLEGGTGRILGGASTEGFGEVLLRKSTHIEIRDGEWLNMESWNLVPGDLVKLTLGDLIPADCVGREIWTHPK